MPTLVHIPRSRQSAAATAELIADYSAFDRRRAWRRQYVKAFAGLAMVVALGGLFRFVPRREALIASALLAMPPAILAVVEVFYWRRLMQRLQAARAAVHQADA